MDPWVYPRERSLGTITLVLGLLAWAILVLGTFGIALVYVLLGFIGYVFAQSAVIAWIKGTAVKLSPTQLPELHARFLDCCTRLGIAQPPEAYLLHGDGIFNAFATRFFGRNFVVLLSDVVDAMEAQPDGISFYIGHELGHIRRGHLTGHIWRAPVLWLPLLGPAYSRAKEYTCDLHGAACCLQADSAPRALVALAAGAQQWRHVNLQGYADQSAGNSGFWASFHELVAGYPWLTKRVARAIDPAAKLPSRNPLAYLLAIFVPYTGRAGGGALALVVVVAVIGVLAAVALPAYKEYEARTTVSAAWAEAAPVRMALEDYYKEREEIPDSLATAGLAETLPSGAAITLDADSMVVDITLPKSTGTLRMEPSATEDGIAWHCVAGDDLPQKALPASCRK
ncbi:Zn-dependent protease with chaperone function/Tfp pilus assembly protein PilE [Variovorax sp. TBS-050B]|uniref:M48 family metallopeptidase n=1 Tax=Variovorax sp. TBS-050B TaxID=2940551 RepID=UPI002476CAE0|nr:M48 family metallopeptidase [Variovorax sp. TBS-050B]MDH6591787.1 Zn-dependent protease with chaperone function/Tfp pilus assembly protein PilE [Variovorax sp. TBS-050B]